MTHHQPRHGLRPVEDYDALPRPTDEGQPPVYNDLIPPPAQPPAPQPRRKRRVFLWVFLGLQLLFILWLVVGLSTAHDAPTAADVAKVCGNGGWRILFQSRADCNVHYAHGLTQAGEAGTAIGAGLVVVVWVVVDFLVGLTYVIYRLARRPARS